MYLAEQGKFQVTADYPTVGTQLFVTIYRAWFCLEMVHALNVKRVMSSTQTITSKSHTGRLPRPDQLHQRPRGADGVPARQHLHVHVLHRVGHHHQCVAWRAVFSIKLICVWCRYIHPSACFFDLPIDFKRSAGRPPRAPDHSPTPQKNTQCKRSRCWSRTPSRA